MGIGHKIKLARVRKNLTQKQLAELVGVTSSAITNYENDTSHPKEQILYKLMKALDVDANFLFSEFFEAEFQLTDTSHESIDRQNNKPADINGELTTDDIIINRLFQALSSDQKTAMIALVKSMLDEQ